MILSFDKDNLKKRQKTIFYNSQNSEYYTIYDFSYKYRTRIFSSNDDELGYVEKDINTEGKAGLYDEKGKLVDQIEISEEGYRSNQYLYSGDIDKGEIKDLFINEDGKLTIFNDEDTLYAIMFLTGMIEVTRKD